MKKWKQKLLAVLASATLAAACLPVAAFAEGETPNPKPEKPSIEKLVNGKDNTSAAAGETVHFSLVSNVPTDLWKCFDFGGEVEGDGDGTSTDGNSGKTIENAMYTLTFHDRMDTELSMVDGSLKVTIGDTTLVAGQYTYETETGDEDPSCTFHVTLDLVELYEAGVITDEDYNYNAEEGKQPASIVVGYDAVLSEDATAGTYKNVSKVSWSKKIVDRENPDDPLPDPDPENPPIDPDDPPDDDESEEDEADVYTYKISLLKVDQDNNAVKLAGAEFKLEMQNEDGEWDVVGENQLTNADGAAAWDGLKEGTYRLTEIKAPSGYIQSTTPMEVVLPGEADETTLTANAQFTNKQTPHTGGSGTLAYTVVGLAILAVAGVGFVVSRKKDR